MIRNWLIRFLRLDHLQKAHDLRAVLNSRLSAENARLKKELNKRRGGIRPNAQLHIDKLHASHAEYKALRHVADQRNVILNRKMVAHLPLALVVQLQKEVDALTDAQVLSWKSPKLKAEVAP